MNPDKIVTVMFDMTEVPMTSFHSMPLALAIEFDTLNRKYGSDIPLADIVPLIRKCIRRDSDFGLFDNMTVGDFNSVLAEWVEKSNRD